jgi:hypothetical protein
VAPKKGEVMHLKLMRVLFLMLGYDDADTRKESTVTIRAFYTETDCSKAQLALLHGKNPDNENDKLRCEHEYIMVVGE